MAEDQYPGTAAPRDPWLFTHLFSTFRVAIDPRKLLLAAAGIVVMAAGWWLISVIFYNAWSKPTVDLTKTAAEIERKNPDKSETERKELLRKAEADRDRKFNEDFDLWLRLHYLAGHGFVTTEYRPVDNLTPTPKTVWGGRLRTLPWYEDRGPNPYSIVTGQATRPWEQGRFAEWFIFEEVPVLLEPLMKFLEPVIHLLNPKTGTYTRLYLLMIILWTLATWGYFGGAITRMACVELAGKDPLSIPEALRYVSRRYVSYLLAPIAPLIAVGALVVLSIIFGLLHLIPFVGDIFVSGLFWPVMILIGLGMALLLVGLVGYPLMYPTLGAEGSDTLDALSRSYNYVYQSPWSYMGYSLMMLLYGAAVIFFVGFFGSLTVYLGKWAMSNTPFINFANRSPEYLFIYTPTSYGWRETLVSGSPAEEITRLKVEEEKWRRHGVSEAEIQRRWNPEQREGLNRKDVAQSSNDSWLESFWIYNHIGAGMVSFWITLVFLMVLGFGYSFFWTGSSMIYMLMRRKVDDIDLDEVYLEESESSDPFGGSPLPMTAPPPPAPTAAPSGGSTTVQETLSVRSDRSPPPPAPEPAPPAPEPAPPPAPLPPTPTPTPEPPPTTP